jgi:hypothetical protein
MRMKNTEKQILKENKKLADNQDVLTKRHCIYTGKNIG